MAQFYSNYLLLVTTFVYINIWSNDTYTKNVAIVAVAWYCCALGALCVFCFIQYEIVNWMTLCFVVRIYHVNAID